uniref:Patatin-like phospholipase family protein n=1 Tax=Desulfacinum infernum TaxID=35837 RepID=A0A832A8A2_9BACT
MGGWLDCYAGSKILDMVRDEGLRRDRVHMVLGAAGGPKWLVLYGLDRVLCREWLPTGKTPLDCLGASIGAWRFAAYCQPDSGEALDRFLEAYRRQSYSMAPTPAEVSRVLGGVLQSFVDADAARKIAAQENRRLHIVTVRGRALLNAEASPLVGLGLAGASLVNSVRPQGLRWFFERTIFSHPQSPIGAELDNGQWPVRRVPLEARNVIPALLASGSIPLLMKPVEDIPGAPPGAYWDGGLTDYHVTVPLRPGSGRIILYPHYTDRLVPGWFDKRFPGRRPDPSRLDEVLLLVPSRRFVDRLPYGRIPDRNDFWVFAGKDSQRLRFWDTVIAASHLLGNEFMDLVLSGTIRRRVRPMEAFWALR